MTWEPKNKLDDEDVDVSDDDDREHSFNRDDKSGERRRTRLKTNRGEGKVKYLLSINDWVNGGGVSLSAVYRRRLRQRRVAPGRRALNTKYHSTLLCSAEY